jgi:hypothetical protein
MLIVNQYSAAIVDQREQPLVSRAHFKSNTAATTTTASPAATA